MIDYPAGFPMTLEAVWALRGEHAFRSPYSPVEEGKPMLCSGGRGHYEWFMSPADAERHLRDGITVDGVALNVKLSPTPFYPFIGAVQIQGTDPEANRVFHDASTIK